MPRAWTVINFKGWPLADTVKLVYTVLLLQVLMASSLSQPDCTSLYEYADAGPPVVEETLLAEDEQLVEYRLVIHSVNDELVPALLSVPKKGGGPFPVIILLHGYGGDKDDLIEAAEPLAQRGYAAAAIDAQYHGERKEEGRNMYSADTEVTIEAFAQTVMDVRRLIDHLETREDVDATRIGLVGASMGALLGTIASGVEPRIDVPVLIVGGGNMTLLIGESQLSRVVEIRAELDEAGRSIQEEAEALLCIDPLTFVGMISPRPLLMINGRNDEIVPVSTNEALYSAARDPKKIIWFDTGHDVPTEKSAMRAFFWFEKHLKRRFYLQNWFYLLVILIVMVPAVIILRGIVAGKP